ncbi:MAG: GntR family transcriptional regulator [Anaerolineales bacterium]|nr:GntR family transcriptional regulator [Anaerolineales bacterium]MCB0005912.1 GntR family transcriptional regulator [Anaerolineales bacterium]MCB0013729.1 GntR family transcriptional regulator [Anaerolineales bacterium]MCB0030717.1 GntR family transcriptional regulator [Anaerolineales bacterium]
MLIERPKLMATRVAEQLRRRIRASEYPAGSRLPSEADLSRELGVSRATLRTALARLATEGLIIRRHGDGTFVNEHLQSVNGTLGGMLNFWQLIEANGQAPSIETVSVGYRPVTPSEADALQIPEAAEALTLVRLFRADGAPFILATNVIPRALIRPDAGPLQGDLPLEQLMQRYCGRTLAYAVYEVRATTLDELAASILARDPGAPLLLLATTFYDSDNRAVVTGSSYYDDAVMSLSFVQSW